MKFYIQSAVVIASVGFIAACGTKSANDPGAPHMASKTVAKTGTSAPTASIKVLSAENFEKIHADENDVAAFYAMNGQILDEAAIKQADPTDSRVRCKTRIQDVRVQDGQVIDQVQVLNAKSDTNTNVFFTNLSRIEKSPDQPDQGRGIAIVCMKTGSAVTNAELKTALQGIVDVSL